MFTVFWGLILAEVKCSQVTSGSCTFRCWLASLNTLKRQHVIITELFTINMWSQKNVYICKQTITTIIVYCKHTITTYTMWMLPFFFWAKKKQRKCFCLGQRQVEYREFLNSSWWTDASHSPSHSSDEMCGAMGARRVHRTDSAWWNSLESETHCESRSTLDSTISSLTAALNVYLSPKALVTCRENSPS